MNIIFIFALTVFYYSLLAIIFKVPSFASAQAFKQIDKKNGIISEILDKFTQLLAPKIKLLVVKKSNTQKMLTVANDTRTPEELVAKAYVNALALLVFMPIIFLIEPVFCIILLLVAGYSYRREFTSVKEAGEKRQRNIENEMLKFVIYMSNALKTEKNIISCIESYKTNFNTPLTEELTLTLAEMRVGNYEQALKNMEKRNNSNVMSKLTRGLLSSMKGDDTQIYFTQLGILLTAEWEETLVRQALLKKPKLTQLSLIMFAVSIVTIFVILMEALSSSSLLFGGTI